MNREEFEALQVGDRVINDRSNSEYVVTSFGFYFGEHGVTFRSALRDGSEEFSITVSTRENDMYSAYRKLEDGDA